MADDPCAPDSDAPPGNPTPGNPTPGCDSSADDETAERFPASGLLRAARRRADLSQRELAARANVSSSTVGRIEAGTLAPSLGTLIRLLRVAGMKLVAIDPERRLVEPMHTFGGALDGADRRYPSHLDTILDPRMGEWWGDRFGLARPPDTFRRDRTLRDAQRARSRWEVRVAQTRHIIPPPRIVPDGRTGRRL
jgi:transcriptional regulator with XRE-family HTH domain